MCMILLQRTIFGPFFREKAAYTSTTHLFMIFCTTFCCDTWVLGKFIVNCAISYKINKAVKDIWGEFVLFCLVQWQMKAKVFHPLSRQPLFRNRQQPHKLKSAAIKMQIQSHQSLHTGSARSEQQIAKTFYRLSILKALNLQTYFA